VGAQQLRSKGAAHRKRYVDDLGFLPDSLEGENHKRFFFRSTAYVRTVQSAQNFIRGLYPEIENMYAL